MNTTMWLILTALVLGGFLALTNRGADPEAAILWCLKKEPGMTGLELSTITGISRSAIYVHLGRMEEAGAVRREDVVNPKFQQITIIRYYAT